MPRTGPASPLARLTALLTAALFIPGLVQKLGGSADSVWLFEQVGLGDAGRYGSAAAEVLAIVLLIRPKTRVLGAFLALGVILGAIGSHLGTDLGVAPVFPSSTDGEGDPTLFAMAVAILVLSVVTILLSRRRPAAD